jgi:hypothetical protein
MWYNEVITYPEGTTMKKTLLIVATVFACFSCTGIDMAARYPNMVADLDPFSVGMANASFDQLFSSKPKPHNIDVIFYPRENTVALEFRHELVRYRQFWNQSARQHFAEALTKYKDDFDNERLVNRFNKTRSAYGRFKGQVEWETFKYTSTYKSLPTYELGYRFKGKGNGVYFTVLQRSAKEETGIMSGSNLESKQYVMYYTRVQGDKLAQLFDQNFLLEKAGVSVGSKPAVSDEPEVDEYRAK